MYELKSKRSGTVSKIENRVFENEVLSSKLMYDLDKLTLYYIVVPDTIPDNRYDLLAEFLYGDVNHFQYLIYFHPYGFKRRDVLRVPTRSELNSVI